MNDIELAEQNKHLYIPTFVPFPDAVKRFSDFYKVPEISDQFFLMLMMELGLSFFICFFGWDWKADVLFYVNDDPNMSLEEEKELIKKADAQQDNLDAMACKLINDASYDGFFAEIMIDDQVRRIMDFSQKNEVCIDGVISNIYYGHGGNFRKRAQEDIAHYLQEKIPTTMGWRTLIINIQALGCEDDSGSYPEFSESLYDDRVKIFRDNLYIKREHLLIVLGITKKFSSPTVEAPIIKRRGVSDDKHNAMTTARNIADSLWRMEQHKDKRISEMANEVYAELHRLGFADHLPEKPENVTNWIRTVAPEHARKAGRPPKTITPNIK